MRKASKATKPSSSEASRRLADLQKSYPVEVLQREDLRQPYRFGEHGSRTDIVVETFTTYGAYQDPI